MCVYQASRNFVSDFKLWVVGEKGDEKEGYSRENDCIRKESSNPFLQNLCFIKFSL